MRYVLGSRASIGGVLGSGRGGAASGNGLLTGLVAYWGLDEASGNALDKHSGGLTLTQVNSPGADTGKVYSTARTFDGGTQYFDRTSSTATQSGGGDFAFAIWFYGTLPGNYRCLFGKRGGGGTISEYEYGVDNFVNNRLRFWIGYTSGLTQVQHTATITANTWHLLICQLFGTEMGIQLNDTTPQTGTLGGSPRQSTNPLRIGAWVDGYYWPGRIGPVAFWKNRTLSAADRAALYNGGAGLAYSAFTA